MIFHHFNWLFALVLMATTSVTLAQVSNVNSTIKIIDGEAYYQHEVLDGQQIEQIASAYYCEVTKIVEANPAIRTGLKTGVLLNIPFTDASLEAMSSSKAPKANAPEPIEEKRIESRPIEAPKMVQQPIIPAKKKQEQSPMQEAVALLTEVEPEEEVIEVEVEPEVTSQEESFMATETIEEEETESELVEEEEPKELAELSNSIKESLNTLQKMKKVLAGESIDQVLDIESKKNEDGSPMGVLQFIEADLNVFIESDTSESHYYLKEFFMARIAPSGLITELDDERTETNENTRILKMNDLVGLSSPKYTQLTEKSALNAFGIMADVKLHNYKVKVKKNKINRYYDDFYKEHLDKSNPHYQLIMDKVAETGEYGKYTIVVVDGELATAIFEKKEYNPFGSLKETIDKVNMMYVSEMQPF